MPRLEWKPSERMGVEAQCGGYTLHVLENPSVADLMAGHATMYEWRVYRHSWVMRVGQRGRDEPRNTMPTMAAAQDAAEAEAARLLAEDAGVRALLAMREPMPTAPTDAVFEQIKSLRRVDPFVKAAFGARLNHPDVEVLSVLVVSLSEDRERLLKENIHHRMASAAGDVGCPEGIAGIAKTWRERAEAAEARVAEMEAALRWRSVGEDLPAAGQCVMVSNPMAGMNPRKEAPRYVERYYNHPHRIWLDLDGRTVPPPTHWRPLLPGPEVKS